MLAKITKLVLNNYGKIDNYFMLPLLRKTRKIFSNNMQQEFGTLQQTLTINILEKIAIKATSN